MITIVLGMGFGDEGKGHVVNELTQNGLADLVVRFNGGHQVGHTVIQNGIRHVFSNFGSGTLNGVPTYWSRFCTVHPLGIINELKILREKGIEPILYIDPLCPIVSSFDINHNQSIERRNKNGSVGVGFGATIQRQEDYFKLFVKDLKYPLVVKQKLQAIMKYYGMEDEEHLYYCMIDNINTLLSENNIIIGKPEILKSNYSNIIFEGGQGILLDQDYGFFPNVTRSNTTCKNAIELSKEFGFESRYKEIIYVTRPYLTRHGAGFLPYENCETGIIKPNIDETNVYNEWQGAFRKAPLSKELMLYAIESNRQHFDSERDGEILYVTCLDQTEGFMTIMMDDGVLVKLEPHELEIAGIHNIAYKGM